MTDSWWVLESEHGWKVVWSEDPPVGGHENGNWKLVEDGLTWGQAVEMSQRLRNELSPKVVARVKWYINHRGKIWGTIFFIIGLLGGNVDRIMEYIPTLKGVVEEPAGAEKTQEKVEKKVDETEKKVIIY